MAIHLTLPPLVDDMPSWLLIQLDAVRASLLAIVPPQTLWLAESLNHSLGRTGKLLRPQMTLLCGQMVNCQDTHALVEAAAVAELIHIATLLHDDVLDDAELRRGLPTVKQRWGNEVAILSGDYLLAQASLKLSKIGNIRLVAIFSEVLAALCEGEVNQLCSRFQINTQLDNYITKCEQKTACLFAAACEAAAVVAQLSETQISAFRQFGLNYGIAFQLVDDLLDVTSNTTSLGKPVMGDICNGLVTAPVILALSHPVHGKTVQTLVTDIFSAIQNEQVLPQLELLKTGLVDSDSLLHTRQLAEQYLTDGLNRLPVLPSPELQQLCTRVFKQLDKLT